MITEKAFKQNLAYLEMNFNIECPPEYLKFIYQALKGKFDDEEMRYGFKILLHKTQDEWNKEYGYKGRPAVADWVNFFNQKKKDDLQAAKDKELYLAMEKIENLKKIAIERGVNISVVQKEHNLLTDNR